MALAKERLNRWRDRRMDRMSRLGLVRAQAAGGGAPAYYVADELLVRDEHRQLARDAFARLGFGPDRTIEAPVAMCGFRRYRARGLDVLAVAETIGRKARDNGDRRPAAAPNHVFLSAPFEHGGTPITTSAVTVLPESSGRALADRNHVVVIDTGIWEDSPLPPDRYIATPTDYESDVDSSSERDVAHANFIVGVIARHAPDVEIRIVRVLDTFGLCTEADLMVALNQLTGGATVVNLSLGGFTVNDEPPRPLTEALRRVLGRGDQLVVAASGNDGERDRPFWPAAFSGTDEPWSDRVVAVAAHDGGELLPWSNTGPWVTLAAPGADVCSTYAHRPGFASGWAVWSGTSFATPYVVAAIVQQLRTVPSPLAALRAILDGATERYGSYLGLR